MFEMLTKRLEEYLETIYDIEKKKGNAKVKDVAECMKVRPSTVTEIFRRLKDEGYVNYEKYKGVTLTKKGVRLVKDLDKKHRILRDFLIILGVDKNAADEDACRIEHVVSKKTIDRLTKFVEFMQRHETPRWFERFKIYCEKGIFIECPRSYDKDK